MGHGHFELEGGESEITPALILKEVDMFNREQRVFTFKLTELIWLFFGAIEGLIGIRILLKLVAANPENAFADFIYTLSDVFLLPFRGLTATPSAGGFVLELPAFVALLVYALLAWGIVRLVWILLYRPPDTRPSPEARVARRSSADD
jgi:uncharacterized protein YggT (Ycf19 family)